MQLLKDITNYMGFPKKQLSTNYIEYHFIKRRIILLGGTRNHESAGITLSNIST